MGKKNICVHTLVKNEERWLWYSISSVIDYVDKILLWDTGSSDKTVEIIKNLQDKYPNKISFKEIGEVGPKQFSKVRQEMIDESNCDWILILDGDEIWSESSIKTLVNAMVDEDNVIVAPFVNFVGDIYHFQDESAGRYKIDGKVGNYTIKAFKKNIIGLKVSNDYGSEGFVDESGNFLQESKLVRRSFIKEPFFHATHLVRSSRDKGVMGRKGKVKHEIGISFPKDFYYPEVFFRDRPDCLTSPWHTISKSYKFRAFIETPLRKIKRRVWLGKPGY